MLVTSMHNHISKYGRPKRNRLLPPQLWHTNSSECRSLAIFQEGPSETSNSEEG